MTLEDMNYRQLERYNYELQDQSAAIKERKLAVQAMMDGEVAKAKAADIWTALPEAIRRELGRKIMGGGNI